MIDDRRYLVADDLSVSSGERIILESISFTMDENRITAFLGASGCGKSTLLRTINQIARDIDGFTLKGKLRIGNESHLLSDAQELPELRQRIGMLFPEPVVFPGSIHKNVSLGLRMSRTPTASMIHEIVRESLTRVELWDELQDKLKLSPSKLPREKQQRLCLARLLAVNPEMLLLDEPTTGLDPKDTARFEGIVHSLKRDITIALATNNVQQAARISDKTIYMEAGQIVESGNTELLFRQPRDKRTENFITGRFEAHS